MSLKILAKRLFCGPSRAECTQELIPALIQAATQQGYDGAQCAAAFKVIQEREPAIAMGRVNVDGYDMRSYGFALHYANTTPVGAIRGTRRLLGLERA